MKKYLLVVFLVFLVIDLSAQYTISGKVHDDGAPMAGALIVADPTNQATVSQADGSFTLTDMAAGSYLLKVQFVGYKQSAISVEIADNISDLEVNLEADPLGLEDVVVSANRYATDRSQAPVQVGVIGRKLLNATQSQNLADGLNFQSGVRVETNCQNCGFTQVRLNGLEGPYTQILVNSRPLFSSLIGVYGLEMIPTYMIDRVEVVKSGGSALYGSNAIAGTINVITKEPVLNRWEVNSNYASVGGEANDWTNSAMGTYVSNELDFGITGFYTNRNREAYDANGDGFTEMVSLKANSFGLKTFYKLNRNTKLNVDFNYIDEFRRGGNALELQPEFTDITEQLAHEIVMSGLSIDHFFNGGKDNISVYTSVQNTNRDSYYGGLGGGRTPADSLLAANAYGMTTDESLISGVQWNHFGNDAHAITSGVEYQYNRTEDEIPGYQRLVDQRVDNLGFYAQWEWQASSRLKMLSGARYDLSKVKGDYQLAGFQRQIDQDIAVLSPRFTLLFDINSKMQFRGGYARGFRAPQAFNEDFHISSAGGEPVFVLLAEDLQKETSDALTGSLSYTKVNGKKQFNTVLQGFYTQLNNPFVLVNTGSQLPNGSIIEEVRNGTGAFVSGMNLEMNYAPDEHWTLQSGLTWQTAQYTEEQVLFEPERPEEGDIVASKDFMRTPEAYGFINLNYSTDKLWEFSFSNVLTGPMQVPEILQDSGVLVIRNSDWFWDATAKVAHHFHIGNKLHIELNAGVQNLFNSFQSDFQTGPTRDSDYIYGPARPRTFFFGIKLSNND